MKVLALDLGTRRVGIAISDATGSLAVPLQVLNRSGDPAGDRLAIARLVQQEEAARVVVGLPRSLSGRLGPAARAILDEVRELSSVVGVPVETYDERFTTVSAHQALQGAGRNSRSRRTTVDMAAAAILLQAWLDAHRSEQAR